MKLNQLINEYDITAHGFAAFKTLEQHCNKSGLPAVLSTLSPAIMLSMGISIYYAPVLPRGMILNTSEEILAADLDVQQVEIVRYPSWDLVNHDKIVIVSRHQDTIDILKGMYPDAPILSENITAENIDRCHVIGTLPPHLIQYAQSYRAVTIDNFDYSKDGDVSGEELKSRIKISDPIQVDIK